MFRSVLAALLLAAVWPSFASAAGDRVLYVVEGGALSPDPAPAARSLPDGDYAAEPAGAAFDLGARAVLVLPSRLLLERGASARLEIGGRTVGTASASGALLPLASERMLVFNNPQAQVRAGDIILLHLTGVRGGGSEPAHLVFRELASSLPPPPPAPTVPPAPAPAPAAPTPAPAPAPQPAPSANASEPVTPASARPPTAESGTSASGSPQRLAAFSVPVGGIAAAMPDATTSLLLLMIAATALASAGLVRLGRI